MSKQITSPSKKWPGSVTLSDPLTMPQVMAFEDAIRHAKSAAIEHGNVVMMKGEDGSESEIANTLSGRYMYEILVGVCACVEKWELEGLGDLTPDTFPGSPKIQSAKLLAWLVDAISKLYNEAEEIPNA